MSEASFCKPCPFCGGTETEVRENGRVWTGMKYGEPASVSIRHWCAAEVGQPSRLLERVGRDHESAVAAWNRRAAPDLLQMLHECAEYIAALNGEQDDYCQRARALIARATGEVK